MMKTVYKLIAFLLLSASSFSTLSAQDIGKFNVNGSVGLSVFFNANLNLEYRITETSKMSSYLALGGGKIASFQMIPHIELTHVFLKGSDNHKFEFGYGLTVFDPADHQDLFLNFRLGYRKMSANNYSFFRTGLSLAEGLYFGWGYQL